MFDQTTLFMVFLMLCFAGIAAMFYFILRGLDELSRELKGERSQLIGLLQSMEASLDIIVKAAQISVQRQANQAASQQSQMQPQMQNQMSGQAVASMRPQAAPAPRSVAYSAQMASPAAPAASVSTSSISTAFADASSASSSDAAYNEAPKQDDLPNLSLGGRNEPRSSSVPVNGGLSLNLKK